MIDGITQPSVDAIYEACDAAGPKGLARIELVKALERICKRGPGSIRPEALQKLLDKAKEEGFLDAFEVGGKEMFRLKQT